MALIMIYNICGIDGFLPLLRSLWIGYAFKTPGFTPGAIIRASFGGIKTQAQYWQTTNIRRCLSSVKPELSYTQIILHKNPILRYCYVSTLAMGLQNCRYRDHICNFKMKFKSFAFGMLAHESISLIFVGYSQYICNPIFSVLELAPNLMAG